MFVSFPEGEKVKPVISTKHAYEVTSIKHGLALTIRSTKLARAEGFGQTLKHVSLCLSLSSLNDPQV